MIFLGLLQYRVSGFYAGCVRLVKQQPKNDSDFLFPYEQCRFDSIYLDELRFFS